MSIRSVILAACVSSAAATNVVWPLVEFAPKTSASSDYVKEGMQAFGEFSASQFVDIPEELVNSDHLMLTFGKPVPADTDFHFKCPHNIEGDTCDIYVFTYHCPPCSLHGGLPAVLIASGWEAGSCAPHFILEKGGEKHEMAAFRKRMQKNTKATFTNTEEGRFIAMAGTPFGSTCSDERSQLTCTNTRHCAWREQTCVDAWCPRRHLPSEAPKVCISCAGDNVDPEPPVAPPVAECAKQLNYNELCQNQETCCKSSMKCKKIWCNTKYLWKCRY
ncbi:hypothetical protein DIPPA_28110 [Diplonema papillatum]|nr:hypothetical protein DIPPA_28110 [Diplonema papillatum]